jgi:signal transduction histidine kinase
MANQSLREQARPELKGAILRSPTQLFLIVTISILVAEIVIMFLFELLPPMPSLVRNIVDGVLLMILIFPILYLFLFYPLKMHTAALQQAEELFSGQNGEQAGRLKAQGDILHSPSWMLFIVAISIMVAETVIMFSLGLLPKMSTPVENIVDSISLTILISPILYLFMFRPLSVHVSALDQAEKSLRLQNEELKEKTRQLIAVQDELVRSEKLALLGQVADTVGHELRNPLGVMNNAVYYLQAVLPDADETTREYLGIIKDEIAEAERIVSDLLDAVRTKPPRPEMVVVAELLGNVLRKCAVPPSIAVRMDIPATTPDIRVDPAQMHQVFWNLIANGVEAMPEGGALEIRAEANPAAHTVAVSIKDSGSGIAPEHQAKLFQPMFTTKARRIGLGLVVVKNLTQANGGSVGVESEVGKGSTFAVTLPCGGVGAV